MCSIMIKWESVKKQNQCRQFKIIPLQAEPFHKWHRTQSGLWGNGTLCASKVSTDPLKVKPRSHCEFSFLPLNQQTFFEHWLCQPGAAWHTNKEKAQFVPDREEEAGCPSIEGYLLITSGAFPGPNQDADDKQKEKRITVGRVGIRKAFVE